MTGVTDRIRGRRKVLIVSYPFYPMFNVGVKQVAKLCKYLPGYGWEPVVLTKDWTEHVAPEDGQFRLTQEPEGLADVGFDLHVARSGYRSHGNFMHRAHRWLMDRTSDGSSATRAMLTLPRRAMSLAWPFFGPVPDEFVGWVDPAVREGVATVRAEGIDAVVSICPPQTAHIVGGMIAREAGIPFVPFFSDLFGFYVGVNDFHGSEWRRRIALARNARWLRGARACVAVSPAMVTYVKEHYGIDGSVIVVGYDPAEKTVPEAEREAVAMLTASEAGVRSMHLVYTGSLYPSQPGVGLLFDALDLIAARSPLAPAQLRAHLVGTGREEVLRAQLAGRPAAKMVHLVPRVSGPVSVALQHAADALLLVNVTSGETIHGTLSYPSKIFEYLHAARPILAFPNDPGGFVDHLVRDTNAGVVAPNAAVLADTIERWLGEWSTRGALAWRGAAEDVQSYAHPAQAARLARLLDRVGGFGTPMPTERPSRWAHA